MTKLSGWKACAAALVMCTVYAIAAKSQSFTTVVNFEGTNGAGPKYVLVAQDINGTGYGTTSGGGANGLDSDYSGTVFQVTPEGTLSTIYSFCSEENCKDGAYPVAGLLLATNGSFYGMTAEGGNPSCEYGCGTIFEITPAGNFKSLHVFDPNQDGAYPYGALIQAADGNLYGVASQGGPNGYGTFFKMSLDGDLTVLFDNFSNSIGGNPTGTLVQGTDGNFYGTNSNGGFGQGGMVFKITSKGLLTTLYSFCSSVGVCPDGSNPFGGVIQATDGNFYGTTALSGGGGGCRKCGGDCCGTVFEITPQGVLTTLHRFVFSDGADVFAGLVQATNGNFIGSTLLGGNVEGNLACADGCGTIFEITSAGAFRTIHKFTLSDGAGPQGEIVQATNGIFYGTASLGGDLTCQAPSGCGTLFSIDTGLGAFVTFVHNSAKVGQQYGTIGQGFTGTTSVTLNGIPASFTVVSDTFIKATVPPGATTGYVTVTTPTGVLTSNVPFHVIP